MNFMANGLYWNLLLKGLCSTVLIAVSSIILGTILGYLVFLMTRSRKRWVQRAAYWYKYIVRGLPVLILLLFIFYVIFSGGNGYIAAIAAFAINYSNFASANIQSSVEAVGRDQVEAAHALGFTRLQTIRYITAPQAIRIALPTVKYNAVSLLKSTSVVGYVATPDLTQATQAIRTASGETLTPLIIATVIYFILAWLLCKGLDQLVKATNRK